MAKINRMEHAKSLRSLRQRLQGMTELFAFSREHNSIRPIRTEKNVSKYSTYLSQRGLVVQVAEVHNQDSVSGKRAITVFIEDLATKLWRLPGQIESVDYEHIQRD